MLVKWNFIGKGSAFYPPYGNTGAYMVFKDTLYLLDCGETAFDILYRNVELPMVNNVYVILTHLHADHVGSLGTLISYFYCLRNIRIHVIHPETTVIRLLALMGLDGDTYEYSPALGENPLDLKAAPVKVPHVDNMECYGYLLSNSAETIYYSGDASQIPPGIKKMFLSGEIARIYQDTSIHRSPNPSHCYYEKLAEEIPPEHRKRVYCMHLDGPCEELLMKKGFQIVSTCSGCQAD